MSRVNAWGTRNLSYAGRARMINSVLMQLHIYWLSIFILPKKVLKAIITMCRNYLWDGKVNSNRVPLVAWETVCKDTNKGRLGIYDCMVWNEAALAKYVWHIANNAENLWVRWINHIYIKDANW